jgi:hypothetical protein
MQGREPRACCPNVVVACMVEEALAIPRRRHGALHHGRALRNGKLRWEPATPEHAASR